MLPGPATLYHHAVDGILAATGASDKLVHVHVGLAIYVIGQIVYRDRRGSAHALKFVFIAEFANEIMDWAYWGDLRLADTLGDIVATVFWPTVLALLSRWRRRAFARRAAQRQTQASVLRSLGAVPAPQHA